MLLLNLFVPVIILLCLGVVIYFATMLSSKIKKNKLYLRNGKDNQHFIFDIRVNTVYAFLLIIIALLSGIFLIWFLIPNIYKNNYVSFVSIVISFIGSVLVSNNTIRKTKESEEKLAIDSIRPVFIVNNTSISFRLLGQAQPALLYIDIYFPKTAKLSNNYKKTISDVKVWKKADFIHEQSYHVLSENKIEKIDTILQEPSSAD